MCKIGVKRNITLPLSIHGYQVKPSGENASFNLAADNKYKGEMLREYEPPPKEQYIYDFLYVCNTNEVSISRSFRDICKK